MTTTTAFTATARFNRLADEANELFNAGFSSKAGQKRALDNLNRAYEEVRNAWRNVQLANAPADMDARHAYFYGADAMDLPFDLHQVRDRHFAMADALTPGAADVIRSLVDLRTAVKAAEIVPPAKDETKVRAARVIEHITALMARRNAQFLNAIDLSEVVEDGVIIHGLSANSHYVTNEHGTTFLRTFFYLHGKLTPLNTILAGAEEAARRAKGE